jgi:type I restriction enzyme R subunit
MRDLGDKAATMKPDTPEAEAREVIDDQLHQTGWAVQSADEMDITAARGVAVREFPLETGFADYLLYGDAKALGTIEAKPKGHTLTGVETQSAKYSAGLPAGLPHFHLPLPFSPGAHRYGGNRRATPVYP